MHQKTFRIFATYALERHGDDEEMGMFTSGRASFGILTCCFLTELA